MESRGTSLYCSFQRTCCQCAELGQNEKGAEITFDRTLTDHFAAILAAFPC